ncbi:MAG: hypothetical protein AAGD18_23020 [Actinomycetota bacterium]
MVALSFRVAVTLLALALVGGCGDADDDASTTTVADPTTSTAPPSAPAPTTGEVAEPTTPTTSGLFTCDGLADRWARIQQDYLDRLGDADAAELAGGSDRVNAAGAFLGPALVEQVRDAEAVGCGDTLQAGSADLCSRMERLTSGGEAADEVIARLMSACGGSEADDLDR